MDELRRLILGEAARQGLSPEDFCRCRLPHSQLGREIIEKIARMAMQAATDGPTDRGE